MFFPISFNKLHGDVLRRRVHVRQEVIGLMDIVGLRDPEGQFDLTEPRGELLVMRPLEAVRHHIRKFHRSLGRSHLCAELPEVAPKCNRHLALLT